jgi:hypothetical protein
MQEINTKGLKERVPCDVRLGLPDVLLLEQKLPVNNIIYNEIQLSNFQMVYRNQSSTVR